jgi:hypothetical protein
VFSFSFCTALSVPVVCYCAALHSRCLSCATALHCTLGACRVLLRCTALSVPVVCYCAALHSRCLSCATALHSRCLCATTVLHSRCLCTLQHCTLGACVLLLYCTLGACVPYSTALSVPVVCYYCRIALLYCRFRLLFFFSFGGACVFLFSCVSSILHVSCICVLHVLLLVYCSTLCVALLYCRCTPSAVLSYRVSRCAYVLLLFFLSALSASYFFTV